MLDDRLYMREAGYAASPWWSATVLVLAANLVMYAFQQINAVYLGTGFESWLALSPDRLARGQVWRLITFQFLHADHLHFLLNSLMLYLIGRPVEEALGSRRLVESYFMAGVAGGILHVMLAWLAPSYFNHPVVGSSAGILGLLAVLCLLDPDRVFLLMFVLPVRARYLLGGAVGIALFFVLVPADTGQAQAAHLGGILAGIGYVHGFVRPERTLFDWRRYGRTIRRRELVGAASGRRPRGLRPRPAAEENESPETFISREVDPILDKISAQGIHSLTPGERRILDAARRKMSQR